MGSFATFLPVHWRVSAVEVRYGREGDSTSGEKLVVGWLSSGVRGDSGDGGVSFNALIRNSRRLTAAAAG